MGATLADGGVHPRTGERVVDLATCRATLTTMLVAGMYETSGDWLYDVGLPGKSGIGGGMVTVSPGKGALGTFSPPLDAAGNSVRGTRTAAYLSRTLGLDILASAPAPQRRGLIYPARSRPTRSRRLRTPTLSNTDLRWSCTVCAEMCSVFAMALVESPRSTCRATSSSRAVRP